MPANDVDSAAIAGSRCADNQPCSESGKSCARQVNIAR